MSWTEFAAVIVAMIAGSVHCHSGSPTCGCRIGVATLRVYGRRPGSCGMRPTSCSHRPLSRPSPIIPLFLAFSLPADDSGDRPVSPTRSRDQRIRRRPLGCVAPGSPSFRTATNSSTAIGQFFVENSSRWQADGTSSTSSWSTFSRASIRCSKPPSSPWSPSGRLHSRAVTTRPGGVVKPKRAR